jgi:hypothetical protein
VLDDLTDCHCLNRGWILVERFDLNLRAWVGRGEHTVTTALIALDPLLPASGGDPQTVDQTMVSGSAEVGLFSAVIESS